jgi:hypothetical protein
MKRREGELLLNTSKLDLCDGGHIPAKQSLSRATANNSRRNGVTHKTMPGIQKNALGLALWGR